MITLDMKMTQMTFSLKGITRYVWREILKNKDTLKAELESYNQEQLKQLEESKKEMELEIRRVEKID